MAVRLLLVLAASAVLYGCGQANSPVERQEEQGGVEQAAREEEQPKPPSSPEGAAQGLDTVFDEANALSAVEEQDVQAAFDRVSEESGEQLYAFLVSDTNTDTADRPEFLAEKASEAGVPPEAGVIVVDTEDRWGLVDVAGDSDQAVYDAMAPHFQDGDFAGGLVAGATQYQDSLSAPYSPTS